MLKLFQKKVIHILLSIVIFAYIIFEELIWETFAKPIYTFLHSLKLLQKMEFYIKKLHRLLLLIIFLSLFIQVELLGAYAIAQFAQGKVYSGILIYSTKIPIGAFTFWLFKASKEKLLSFTWFKLSYDYILKIIEKVQNSEIYKEIKLKSSSIKKQIKKLKTKYFSKNSNLKKRAKKIYINIKKALSS